MSSQPPDRPTERWQPPQQPTQPLPGWGQQPTQPQWGPPPVGPPPQPPGPPYGQQPGWGPPPPKKPSGDGVRSFLGRHPLVFFGGILLALVLIGAMFGSSDDSAGTTSQEATADTPSYTLPTVAQTDVNAGRVLDGWRRSNP